MIRLLCFILLFAPFTLLAQGEDKAVIKEWKRKMKETDPLEFKRIVEERDTYRNETDRLRDDVTRKDGEITQLQESLTKQKLDFEKMSSQVQQLEQGGKSLSNSNAGSGTADDPNTGVVYKVQIGSFRNLELSKFLDNNPNFSGETGEDGMRKYTLGSFRDYWEADNFKKYLREMGVSDAWVVAYKDARRVSIKEAREGAL